MTTNYTLFQNTLIQAAYDSVSDLTLSSLFTRFDASSRYAVENMLHTQVTLALAATYQLQLSALTAAQWHTIVVRCIGQGHVSLAGLNSSSGAITSKTPVYGTSVLPGIAVISTYNLTAAPTIVSDAAGSIFDIFDFTCVQDGN